MPPKRKDPGRAFSPARKALSRSGLGSCRSPRRGLSTSFQASSKPTPSARPGARPGVSSKGSSANMKVIVRVRPLSNREMGNNARVIVDVVDEKMVVFDPKKEEESFFFQGVKQKGRDMLKKQNKNTQYLFDRVFGSEATNKEVFEGSTKSIVNSVLDGFNCSVFVYGATGAGKTFTMLGTQENPGITFRTMVELFKQINEQAHEKTFDIGVSYLEVYNETVRDLLNPTSGALFLREDGGGVVVAGLKLERISDPDRMFELLEYGNRNRTQHPTDANAESSRSHAVFQVFIKMKTKANGQTKMVKLSMIDLAGSERGAATGCSGVRFKEGSNINKSLLALGNCINALADGLRHIPFRDSKLTRLLKDSLGGNCQTVMIANVAPAHYTYEDTHNTLKYATRAKSIKFQIKRNVVSVELHVSHYVKMVEDLQVENERLKSETDRLKRELEEERALRQSATSADSVPADACPPAQSHLPPAVAAAVAAINNKIKPAVSTSTVALNTSPLKELARNDDLQRLKAEAEKLYSEKARLHHRYLNMYSSDKVLRWRIKLKQRTIERVSAMSSTPSRTDQAQIKGEKSLDQFKGRLNSVNECQEAVSIEEKEINDRLANIKEESKRLGILDEVSSCLQAFELQFQNQDLHLKCQHFEKLIEFLDSGFESHDDVLMKISNLFRTYYNLVRGHGHMNEELKSEHEAVMRGLEGIKCVQWRHERDQVFLADEKTDVEMLNIRPSIQHSTSESSAHVPSTSAPPASLTAQASFIPQSNVQDVGRTALLRSPLCSSSSNLLNMPMDTAAILDSLGDLDSKVDNILNTSVSSLTVETGTAMDGGTSTKDKSGSLNVTFDGESNLNSTFTKEDEEANKMNETFEEEKERDHLLPNIGDDKLNGTFSLNDDSSVPQGTSVPHVSTEVLSSLRKVVSPSLLPAGSSLQRTLSAPASRSPSGIPSISNSSVKKDPAGSPALGSIGLLKKPISQSSSSPSQVLPNAASLLKKPSSPSTLQSTLASKKTASPPTFAVPAAVPARSMPPQKRPVGAGIVDKRKALGINVGSTKQPNTKLLSITRKVPGLNPKINLNTPSKVKLAWNKENRILSTVPCATAASTLKPTKPVGMKPVTKPSGAPVVMNDTFTKL